LQKWEVPQLEHDLLKFSFIDEEVFGYRHAVGNLLVEDYGLKLLYYGIVLKLLV
jgi:hypothetical protein